MNPLSSKPPTVLVRVIGQCLCDAAERTGREVGQLEAAAWCRAFADCDPVELRQAFDSFAVHGRVPLSMSAIHQELQRLQFGGVSGAWAMVHQAAKESFYGHCFVVFEHPAMHFAIDAVGGWFQLTRQIKDMDRVGFIQRDFVKAFEDYRSSLPHSAGMGSFNGENAVLIGHRARALRVYRTGVKDGRSGVAGIDLLRSHARGAAYTETILWPEQLEPEHMARTVEPCSQPRRMPWDTDKDMEALSLNPPDNGL
jgi:hypothetical protein